MAFAQYGQQKDVLKLLHRCLQRGRLAHAYLFAGTELAELEGIARTLAKALNCAQPPAKGEGGLGLDSCDQCESCRRIDADTHPDIVWVRPESKSRVITVDQMRDLMHTIFLKPTVACWKVSVIVCADRLNPQAANAFLKTLEEPPPRSLVVLLTTDAERVLETIVSRCLRLNFAGGSMHPDKPEFLRWLNGFAELAAVEQRSLLGRYQLLSIVLNRLQEMKTAISEDLTKKSPLERYDDMDPKTRDRLEDELAAAIEAEYRRARVELIAGIQWWLRDIWLQTMSIPSDSLSYPQFGKQAQAVAQRVKPAQARDNLSGIEQVQRLLGSNVQEALTLEVGLLRLKL